MNTQDPNDVTPSSGGSLSPSGVVLSGVVLAVFTGALFLLSQAALAPLLRWSVLGAVMCVQAALALRFLLHLPTEPRWLRSGFWLVLFFAVALVFLPTLAQWGSATL